MTQCFAPLGEGCGEGVQHPSPLSYVASKAQQLKSLKRDKLLCFFFLVKMAESEITEASIKDALTQRLKAIHAEVTDMSGMSLVSSGR